MKLRMTLASALVSAACVAGIVMGGEAGAAPLPANPIAAASTDAALPIAPKAAVAPKAAPAAPGEKPAAAPPGPATRAERDQQALSKLGGNLGTGVGIGALVGTTIGAVVGCAMGLVGGPVGCVGGLMTLAGLGGILGTIAVGGPTLIGNAIDYFKTVNTPFVPPAK